jgi:hypothetical protein
MSQELTAGARLYSTSCTTQVVVVKPPSGPVDLRIGGAPVSDAEPTETVAIDPAFAEGTQIGKRYTDEETGIELLVAKAGDGSISIDDRVLDIKGAKPLPSSD